MIFTGLIFLGVCALLNKLLHLPFAIYKTFVIEQKYGFNKTRRAHLSWTFSRASC